MFRHLTLAATIRSKDPALADRLKVSAGRLTMSDGHYDVTLPDGEVVHCESAEYAERVLDWIEQQMKHGGSCGNEANRASARLTDVAGLMDTRSR